MERQAKDGTIYQQVGEDSWSPVTRAAKDGTIYKKVGADAWSPLANSSKPAPSEALPEPSTIGVGVRNLVQGATANFSDEIAGAVEGVGRMAGYTGAGGPMKDIAKAPGGPTMDWETLKNAYVRARDKERATLKNDADNRPGLAAMSNLAGAIVSPVNKIANGMSVAKGGAAIGGLTSLGASDAKDLKGAAIDTGIGLAAGATIGKVVDKAAPYIDSAVKKVGIDTAIKKAGEKSSELAERFAARAIGAERGSINKFGQDQVQKAGRYALDNDVVTALNNTDEKIAANEATKASAMNDRKKAYDAIDAKGQSAFNPLDAASKAEEKVLGGKNMAHDDVKELSQALDPHLSNILSRGDKNISMAEAQDLVEALSKKAKFDTSRSTMQNQVAKDVYQSVRQSINEAAEKGADDIGIPGLRKVIENANETYRSGKTASALLKNKLAREQGNKLLGITDAVAGGAALGYGKTTDDWTGAAGILVAKRGLQKYGPQLAARGLDRIAKSLIGVPELAQLAEKSPAVFQSLVSRIHGSEALPAAADNSEPKKGPEKWARDGFDKLQEHADEKDKATIEKAKGALLADPKAKKLLVSASDLKPGSKAMEKVLNQINSHLDKGGN